MSKLRIQCTPTVDSLLLPPGLESLCSACEKIYPNQKNPLQASAVLKYWLGGPDPLDYISMYINDGNPSINVPPHWHYISFGLSDLHGDGRVHAITGPNLPSGFGFELTFRLEINLDIDDGKPPTWPAALLQSLAKYIFSSRNIFCSGDHISWHNGLDGNQNTKIKHMLVSNDPQLTTVETPCGSVEFFQIVGVMEDELHAAQRWNGQDLLDILKRVPNVGGGDWMVTNINRQMSIFELDANIQQYVEMGITEKGSNLTGVSCHCYWADFFLSGEEFINYDELKISRRSIVNDFYDAYMQTSQRISGQGITFNSLQCIHIMLNKEAGLLLPLVIRGRLNHGRHFTFNNVSGEIAITFVAWSVTGPGVFVNKDRPFVLCKSWLQIYIPEDFIPLLDEEFNIFHSLVQNVNLPKSFFWEDRNFAITIVPDNNN